MSAKQPLSVTHPELAKQAVDWDPSGVTAGSQKRVMWKCTKGHLWEARVGARAIKGTNCPYCSNYRVLAGFNDIATTHPEIASQAFGWDTTEKIMGTAEKFQWQCSNNHIWTASGNDRKSGYGCPYCSGRLPVVGVNDLGTTHPELSRELVEEDPQSYSAGSGKKPLWQCQKKHTWKASVAERVAGTGCPYCAGKKVLAGFNDLATTHPKLADEADGWDPKSLNFGSNKIVGWICKEGHKWRTSVSGRSNNRGCPTCKNRKVLAGFNDLATEFPEIATEADGWDPTTTTHGTNTVFDWRCQLGHRWKASVANRTGKNTTGCPICSNNLLLVGFNDLATTHPEVAIEAHNWDPTTVISGANIRKEWKCKKGHVWVALCSSRSSSGNGCPYCAFKKLLRGFNDLATTHPQLATQANGWDPTTLIDGSKNKYSWKCEKEHIWTATISDRKQGYGCPSCAVSGFDPNSEGWLYFLKHSRWQMLQIGITNFPEARLNSHKRLGWKLIELRGPMDGLIARAWEKSLLKTLKAHGAHLGDESIAGRFDGYTEAWTSKSLSVKTLQEMMKFVHDEESA
jgi:hypothetical protein